MRMVRMVNAFVCSLFVLSLILVGCGAPTPTPAPAEPTTKAAEPTPTEVPAPTPTKVPAPTPTEVPEEVTLQFMTFDSTLEMEFWQNAANEYAATVPGLTVEIMGIPWDKYEEKVMAMVAAGTPPDLIYSTDRRSVGWADKGILLDLKPFMDSDPNFRLEDFNVEDVQWHTWKGTQYMLPADTGPIIWAYNKTLFEEQGVKTPYEYYEEGNWNWDTFLELAKTMTKDMDGDGKIDQYGYYIMPWWVGDLPGWLWANGGNILDRDGTKCLLTEPESLEALQFVSDMINVDNVAVVQMAKRPPGMEDPFSFYAGNVAMSYYHTGSTQTLRDYTEGFVFDAVPKPTPKGKEHLARHYNGGSGYAIFSGSKHPELAWELVMYFLSPEVQMARAEVVGRVPSRLKEGAEYLKLMEGEEEPVHIKPLIEALETTRRPNLHPAYNEIDAARVEAFEGVWLEGKSVEEAAQEACERINEILNR